MYWEYNARTKLVVVTFLIVEPFPRPTSITLVQFTYSYLPRTVVFLVKTLYCKCNIV